VTDAPGLSLRTTIVLCGGLVASSATDSGSAIRLSSTWKVIGALSGLPSAWSKMSATPTRMLPSNCLLRAW
jgi:hypothetical protein